MRPSSSAAAEGDKATVAELLRADPRLLDAADEDGRTPLLYAVGWGHQEIVELLLGQGAQVHLTDKEGRTPLHWAAGLGHKPIAVMLLTKRPNLYAKFAPKPHRRNGRRKSRHTRAALSTSTASGSRSTTCTVLGV